MDLFGRFRLEIWMKAEETQSDWTTAEGEHYVDDFIEIQKLREGWVLDEFITPLKNELRYRDDNEDPDLKYPSSPGPAEYFIVVGDTQGNEAGTKTMVTVHFSRIAFQIRQSENCTRSP
jgi:hypothetical protein